jgi:hypothetical protein
MWLCFPVALVALYSYPFIFVRWAATRDLPWVNLLLGATAVALALAGVKRSFNRGWIFRAVALVIGAASIAAVGLFVYKVLIVSRELPVSAHAPAVGEPAPDFTLVDLNHQSVSLSSLRTMPLADGRAPRGVLLIFYRGYW